MVNRTVDDQEETGNSNKLSEFSRRWYQAHVRRAEADRDHGESGRPSAPRAGGPGQSARGFLEFCTGVRLPTAPAERDTRFAQLRAELDGDADRFERVVTWWAEEKPTFLDPVLVDRCEYGFNNRNEESIESLRSNADAMVAIAAHLGPAMVDHLSVAAGRPLKASRPPVLWTSGGWGRPDMWVDWRVEGGGRWQLGLRLWINNKGAALGVLPGWGIRQGWKAEAEEVIRSKPVHGFRIMERGDSKDMGFFGTIGSFFYGCSYERGELAGLDLRSEAERVATAASPVLDALVSRARGESSPESSVEADPLARAVEEFLRDTGYPTASDEEQRAHQSRFREMLLPENTGTVRRSQLRRIWTSGDYGYPGMQSHLNAVVDAADGTEYERILETFEYVCWGDDDDAERIDTVLKDPAYRVRGLGESVTLKLLAICHPDRYLCVFPYSGENGKLRMLKALDLPEPPKEATRGHKHVESNDRLRERLEPFFPGDHWGMTCFLYWYVDWAGPGTLGDTEKTEPPDPVAAAAADLLIGRSFLDDIVDLLEDKGQVILYGPPGTGKTFLAQRLAEALTSDSADRALVQFHPSTSYEDFFEGYRPERDRMDRSSTG